MIHFQSLLPVEFDTGSRLFRKNGMARVVRLYPFDDQFFRRQIGFGHQIDVAFI